MSSEASSRAATKVQSEPFQYATILEDAKGGNRDAESAWTRPASGPVGEQRDKEAFERGLREGENRAKVVCEARETASRDAVRKAVEAFRTEREEYFSRVEPEVVQLSLAIARKILHREAQVDPLLLSGLVHVALEKLDAGTRVRLRVPPVDTHFWNECFAESGGTILPEISGDPALKHGECALETEIGSTQISLETQLKEIEQGFFDLLEQRPRVR
jgi:flagellar biosynthesis/type III secretory pathway protein FliH